MIRQDVLMFPDERTGQRVWTFFACSKKGAGAIVEAGGEEPIGVLYWRPANAKLGLKVLHRLYDMNAMNVLNAHIVDYMPFEAVCINAAQMKIEHDRDGLGQQIADYFGPLFDAAIDSRDKSQITELFNQMPQGVEKASIADRLRQTFPELKKEGVTVQNWHESAT